MKAICPHCNIEFKFTKEQEEFIKDSKDKEMNFIMIGCSNCNRNFPINPSSLDLNVKTEVNLRCPISGCCGFISEIIDNDEQFYGCGECGAIWYNINNLFNEIANIIKIYPYRKKVYILKGEKEFAPISIENSPKEYEQLVEQEPKEKMQNFVRG